MGQVYLMASQLGMALLSTRENTVRTDTAITLHDSEPLTCCHDVLNKTILW